MKRIRASLRAIQGLHAEYGPQRHCVDAVAFNKVGAVVGGGGGGVERESIIVDGGSREGEGAGIAQWLERRTRD